MAGRPNTSDLTCGPNDQRPATRLAPSPTGALHLGNARTFLINWALARQRGWRVIMRMEDLDGPRVKQGADQQALDALRWLGIDWDGEILYQSADLSPYQEALERLQQAGLIYHCRCSRKDIAAAQSAPHEGGELRYPGTCRPNAMGDQNNQLSSHWMTANATAGETPPARNSSQEAPGTPAGSVKSSESHESSSASTAPPLLAEDASAWRIHVPDEPIGFDDEVAGPQSINVQRQAGDFIVATKAGMPAYQLAVVVDDARQGVTDVVRADDLIKSTPRQLLLYRALGLSPRPRYYHLPLVLGPDGRRLAKRHGDTRLVAYRDRGVPAKRIVGLIAHWSGMLESPAPMTADQFCQHFELTALPRQPVTLTEAQANWLETGQLP